MGQTMTPNAVARVLSTPKRTVTSKAVRTMARTTLARFDKTKHPQYQSHLYSAAEVASLRKAFASRGQRSAAQPVRKASKSRAPRKATAPVVTE